MGKVYLIGAGCGDVELITMKGKRILEQADCVLYDRLIDPLLLQYTSPTCKHIYVGKENHHHVMNQHEIEALLISCAQTYEYVVRLKGGDPFVFGRGGEEILALSNAGIAFDVIPGISSAVGGLAYAGIPITHRGLTTGFRVYTAHSQHNKLSDLNFQELANTKDTLVFLMGLSSAHQIIQSLMTHGKPDSTPAAICSCVSTPMQQCHYGTLASLLEINLQDVLSPSMIVVGEVVALHSIMQVSKPLLGKHYAMTSLQAGVDPIAIQLRACGASIDLLSCGHIEACCNPIHDLKLISYSHIIFVSRNAVHYTMKQLLDQHMDVRALANMRVAAMGEQTKQTLLSYGIQADILPDVYDSEHMITTLKSELTSEHIVLICKGENQNTVLQDELSCICRVDVWHAYKTIPHQIHNIRSFYHGILLSSTFHAQQLFTQATFSKQQRFYSIGSKTTNTIQYYGYKNIIQLKQAVKEEFITSILEEAQHV